VTPAQILVQTLAQATLVVQTQAQVIPVRATLVVQTLAVVIPAAATLVAAFGLIQTSGW
jgi:hypothetical protein